MRADVLAILATSPFPDAVIASVTGGGRHFLHVMVMCLNTGRCAKVSAWWMANGHHAMMTKWALRRLEL